MYYHFLDTVLSISICVLPLLALVPESSGYAARNVVSIVARHTDSFDLTHGCLHDSIELHFV